MRFSGPLLNRRDLTLRQLYELAMICANHSLDVFRETVPGDSRVSYAISVAEELIDVDGVDPGLVMEAGTLAEQAARHAGKLSGLPYAEASVGYNAATVAYRLATLAAMAMYERRRGAPSAGGPDPHGLADDAWSSARSALAGRPNALSALDQAVTTLIAPHPPVAAASS